MPIVGTPVQGPNIQIPDGTALVIMPHPNNVGVITVGDTAANAVNTVTNNFRLLTGQSLSLEVRNMNSLWFDVTVAGDDVMLIAEGPSTSPT